MTHVKACAERYMLMLMQTLQQIFRGHALMVIVCIFNQYFLFSAGPELSAEPCGRQWGRWEGRRKSRRWGST
jgi:hypothetical protein